MRKSKDLIFEDIKELVFEIGFIEETRNILEGIKKCPKLFFYYFLYLQNYDLIRLTPTIGNPAFRNFETARKAYCKSVVLA